VHNLEASIEQHVNNAKKLKDELRCIKVQLQDMEKELGKANRKIK
jgi:hypothetical protein